MVVAASKVGGLVAAASAVSGVVTLRKATSPYAYQTAWTAHSGYGIFALAFSPDGKYLATGATDTNVKIWEVATKKLLVNFTSHSSYVYDIRFVPGTDLVISVSYDRYIRVWDTKTKKQVRAIRTPNIIRGGSLHPKNTWFAVASEDKNVYIYDYSKSSNNLLKTLKGHTSRVWQVDFSPDGKWLASSSDDRSVRIWDPATGKQKYRMTGHSTAVYGVRFSPDGKTIASTGASGRRVRLWDPSTGKETYRFENASITYSDRLAWSADGKHIFTSSQEQMLRVLTISNKASRNIGSIFRDLRVSVAIRRDGEQVAAANHSSTEIQIFQLATKKQLQVLKGHTSYVTELAYVGDGNRLVSGSWDKTVRVWDAASGMSLKTLTGHTSAVNAVAVSPQGGLIAAGSSDKTIRIWDAASYKLLHTLKGHTGAVRKVVFTADGKRLLSGSDDGNVRIWEVDSGKSIKTIKANSLGVMSIAVRSDQSIFATSGWDRTIRVWDMASGTQLRSWAAHSLLVTDLLFFPNSSRVASVSYDRWLRVWDADTGLREDYPGAHDQPISSVVLHPKRPELITGSWDGMVARWRMNVASSKTFERMIDTPTRMALSPNSQWIAVAFEEKKIGVWRTSDGKLMRLAEDVHDTFVRAIVFTPDGQHYISAADNGIVKIWKLADGSLVKTITAHKERISDLAVSADGKMLASASWDTTVKLWKLPEGTAIRTLQGSEHYMYTVTFQKDGKQILGGTYGKEVFHWETETGKELNKWTTGLGGHTRILFAPNNTTRFFTASFDGYFRYWQLSDGRVLRNFLGHEGPVFGMSMRADGQYAATSARDGTVRIWRISDGTERAQLKGHTRPVIDVAYGGDGMVYSLSEDLTIRAWRMPASRMFETFSLRGRNAGISSMMITPDGKNMVTGGEGRRFRHVTPADRRIVRTMYGAAGIIRASALTVDGKIAAAGSDDNAIRVFQVSDGKTLKTLSKPHKAGILSMVFTPDGKHLLSAGTEEAVIKRWDTKEWKEVGTLVCHGKPVFAMAFADKGALLMSASQDNTVRLWKTSDWSLIRTISTFDGTLTSAAVSPDGKLIVAAHASSKLKLFGQDGKTQREWDAGQAVVKVRFGGNGDWIVALLADGSLKLWQTKHGRLVQSLQGEFHSSRLLSVAADGSTIAVGDANGYLSLWRCAP
jgi:WD40 repeat protein